MAHANVPFSAIQFDSLTQLRAAIDNEVVQDYADALAAGEKFPPLELFEDRCKGGVKVYFIGDGWHRALAYQRNGDVSVPATIHQGGKKEALAYALSANARHGLKRSTADKAKAVKVAFKEFAGMSDRAIAELCAVGHPFVAKIRREVQVESDSNSTANQLTKRTGRDGKQYRAEMPAKPKTGAAEVIELPPASKGPLTEEEIRLATEAVMEALPGEQGEAALQASPSAEVRAPLLRPSEQAGAFDSGAWKAEFTAAQRELIHRFISKVPAKQREKAQAWIVENVGSISAA